MVLRGKALAQQLVYAVLLFLVAFAFLALFSRTTSFWRPTYGADSAIFRLIGLSLAQGKELYVDVWDHKGPVLFFLQWLPQAIWPGRIGLFVLQVVLLFASLLALSAMVRPKAGLVGSAATVGVYLLFLVAPLQGGNLSEEYSLPPIVLVAFLFTKAVQEPSLLSGKWAFWAFPLAGAAFAVVILIRANNALPILGLFAGYFLAALIRKTPFVRDLLLSIGGFAATLAVVSAWFLARGTFGEMWRAAFTFNLDYARAATASNSLASKPPLVLLIVGVGVLIAIAGAAVQYFSPSGKKSHTIIALCFAGATAFAVLSPSTSYLHYAALVAPLAAYGTILILCGTKQVVGWVVLCSLVVVAGVGQGALVKVSQIGVSGEAAEMQALDSIMANVPGDEIDDVFTWNVSSKYFLHYETLPKERYYTMQTWWGSIDPEILTEVTQYVDKEKPPWILVKGENIGSDQMQRLVDADYSLVENNGAFQLFRINDTGQ